MSELTIELNETLKVVVNDWAGGDPHVSLEGKGGTLRIEAADVGRLADALIGARVMMPEPDVVESSWRGTGGYPALDTVRDT